MISPEDTYPGKTVPASANYPEGAIKNETIPNSSDDGTPLDELWGNDFEGLKQAIARSASIVPTLPGNIPDTATASQVLQGLIEMIQGRAINYDESGVADAYILDARANQQEPADLFNDQEFYFVAGNTNTVLSTIDLLGLGGGVKNIVNSIDAGTIVAGNRYGVRYRLGTDDVELLNPLVPSEIRLNTANGYGSTNNKIRRFSSVVTNQGSDISYADSATLGASFTVNTTGIYAINHTDTGLTGLVAGISLNSTQLTTNIKDITLADIVSFSRDATAETSTSVSTLFLEAGDIIRPHTDGAVNDPIYPALFTITKVG